MTAAMVDIAVVAFVVAEAIEVEEDEGREAWGVVVGFEEAIAAASLSGLLACLL